MYGIYDPPSGATPPVGFAGIPNRNNLQQQVLAVENVAGVSVRTAPNPSTVTLPPTSGAVRGWYMDLSLNPGERIVTDPQIESVGGLVFTTATLERPLATAALQAEGTAAHRSSLAMIAPVWTLRP